jgi:DNA-binding NtrC family response regulator
MADQTSIAPSIGQATARNSAATDWVLGQNLRMHQIARHAERAAQADCTVLVSGETGTGKELWAKLVHERGPRAGKPFIPVNCAALTVTLAESQLFGHEKGAFTGAAGRSAGVFRAAEGGTVFLDEVGEMPLELQPKLLRVLQQREVTPVGSAYPVPVDVQIIAATNRDLEAEVAEGRFREDLLYRLNMVELRVPPLRDRVEDIPELIEFFSRRFSAQYKRPLWHPDAATLKQFCEFPWPGNVRQLSHVIEQSYVLDCAPLLPHVESVAPVDVTLPYMDLARLRFAAINQALQTTRGHKGRAAKLLGVHANTLTRMLAQMEADAVTVGGPVRVGKAPRRKPR